jgi:uncharacterized protein YpmB
MLRNAQTRTVASVVIKHSIIIIIIILIISVTPFLIWDESSWQFHKEAQANEATQKYSSTTSAFASPLRRVGQ